MRTCPNCCSEIAENNNKMKVEGQEIPPRDYRGIRIVREYTDDMAGKEIPDNRVVEPRNGRFFGTLDGKTTKEWFRKSTDECGTYGNCEMCWSSGPTGMHCQVCKDKDYYYKVMWYSVGDQKWLDAKWISRILRLPHLSAAADRVQTYPEYTTACMGFNMDILRMKLSGRLRELRAQGLWTGTDEEIENEESRTMRLFREGLETDEAGEWDFPHLTHTVRIPYNTPIWNGTDQNDQQGK
jgi:hypothetical protein